ncbi:SDR family oxidoreductase [Mariniphaga sediminis]|uniref:SDR family oxidoreductase n=1 Tax=Mariniphaga sediminis TaxID=1628158 RepID=A0A399D2H3_9BACT|nr:SDR family oxidoreductase [Mariniphaga sediminis]RIH65398.1 SDR family oxidoreductase [Mariniphaga sediminis]
MEIKKLFNLKGKTALVTGGSQGIGKAISLALAEYGANLVINYRSNKDLAEQTKKEIIDKGAKCWLVECDLSQVDSAKIISRFLDKNGLSPDILVLNASVQYRKAWDEVTSEEFEAQININFRAALFLIQELFPNMKKNKWGRIVTLGSVQQSRPHPEMIVYAASKMAQLSMVKNLAAQIGKYGVTINNLAPGVFPTIRNEEVLQNEKYKAIVEGKIPLGFIGDPVDCAATTLLLCSDAGRYITGQDIFVDGGMGLNF